MQIKNISPGSTDRLRLLITKSAETLRSYAELVKCPEKRQRLQARAERVQQRAKEL